MLYVYKLSDKPLQPWSMLRTGGANNVAPDAKGRYLVLQNAEALYRDGAWHYVLEFDVRDTLTLSPLALMMGKKSAPSSYPDGTNWRKWLGDNWQVIDEHVRWKILHEPQADSYNGTEGQISDVRELPEWHPQPHPQKRLTLFPTPVPVATTVPAGLAALPEIKLPEVPAPTPAPAPAAAKTTETPVPLTPRAAAANQTKSANGKKLDFPLDLDAALGGAVAQPVA
jgi:hypothetical protein